MQELRADISEDESTINRVLAGNASAYESLIRRYNSFLYKIGRGYGFNHEDTEDLMQDTFVSAYFRLDSFRKESSFRTWLTRIMLNNCYHKKQKLRPMADLPENEYSQPLFSHPAVNPERAAIQKELGRIMEQAIAGLSEDYRLTFVLRQLSGLSVKETAAALDASEQNVKMRFSRARAILRREIEKTYPPEQLFEFDLKYCDLMVNRVMLHIDEKQKGDAEL